VEDDLRKLGVKRWRTKALEREEWASIIKEAKAKLKGPKCYRKKKKTKEKKKKTKKTKKKKKKKWQLGFNSAFKGLTLPRIKKLEDSFHQAIGFKCKEETSKVLHLEHSCMCCSDLDTLESTG
jgi:hypothetical protein